MTDNSFTARIRDWLDARHEERDYNEGALLLLKLSGNQIMYRNIMINPADKAEFIEYQIRKYYDFRVRNLTHKQVEDMQKHVDKILKKNIPLAAKADTAHNGKRDDHDDLPDNIKALYVENLSLLRKIRDLHLKLRSLSLDNAACPDSERFPFLKEIIALDKKMHANWKKYDSFIRK